jgi:bacterioferritin-associated ferredoxin
MIVCLCHRVTDRDIAREAAAGCPSFEVLQEELRVGTACGACVDCAHETFHAHAAGACHGCDGAARRGGTSVLVA